MKDLVRRSAAEEPSYALLCVAYVVNFVVERILQSV